jgi:hypothetical protein
MQELTNNGVATVAVPYTVAITNPSYALINGASSAWNWDVSGPASDGTFSGLVTEVSRPDALVSDTS